MSEDHQQHQLGESDFFLLLVLCSKTKEILIQKAPNPRPLHKDAVSQERRPLFLPMAKSDKVSGSWKSSAMDVMSQVFQNVRIAPEKGARQLMDYVQLVRISRFWFPMTAMESIFLQRFLLFLSITEDEKNLVHPRNDFIWCSVHSALSQGFLDPEISEAVKKIYSEGNLNTAFTFREYNEESFLTDPNAEKVPEAKKIQTALTKAACVSLEDQRRLYKEFLSLTFPLLFMSCPQFEKLMLQFGWEADEIQSLFRSFNTRCGTPGTDHLRHFISFSEVLCGISATEPDTPHGDQSGEARCRYIFRYYHKDQSSCKISFDEFCQMVKDIRRAKGFSTDQQDVEKEARASSKVFGSEENNDLSLNDFLIGVGQLKFRGTSYLLRAPDSAFAILKAKETDGNLKNHKKRKRSRPDPPPDPTVISFENMIGEDPDEIDLSLTTIASSSSSKDTIYHRDIPYDFATHVVKVRRSGQVVNVESLFEMGEEATEGLSPTFVTSQRGNFGRLQSIREFSIGSEANEMLVALRFFERPSKGSANPPKPPLNWGSVSMSTFAKSLIDICQQARGLLIQEPRLIKLTSPAYILGDLHGNFHDLSCFEKVLWRMGPKLVPGNFLFLGDYVDRGDFGCEVVAYLFAQKVTAPTKFHLLRGNHECRYIQKNFTFHKECLDKFGPDLGEKVWEEVNLVFDVMPIGAVIDGKIFCVHGGIPPPWLGNGLISSLDKVNKDLPNVENEQLVWEFLWNDPMPPLNQENVQIPEQARVQVMDPAYKGFVNNWRRGTGHMFTDAALDEFLKRNGLSHVIRAHEVKQTGFQVQHGQKLLTVFSSSKYCNTANEAACALADNRKLRLIRLDTS